MSGGPRFAAIGLDHRHIHHLVGEMIAAGAVCAGYCPETSDPRVLDGFRERFPALEPVPRERLFDDPAIAAVVCAAVPRDRAAIAIRAMRAGKDVMVDKPGVTTAADLDRVAAAARETGRIWSVCFSERLVVRACALASRLVADGAIGRVIHVAGLGPHRLNRAIRPAWFFERAAHGGILTDIGSHQIDQFLHYAGLGDARIAASAVANRGTPDLPDFEDYGEILLHGDGAAGFVRVDWFTPDGLAAWGDGRLFLTGTEGTIELRKYIDPAGRPGGDHLFLTDRAGTRHLDASAEPLPYFRRFLADMAARSETALPPGHAERVMRLALAAQAGAARLGG
jgi:predicted dehydrogenase